MSINVIADSLRKLYTMDDSDNLSKAIQVLVANSCALCMKIPPNANISFSDAWVHSFRPIRDMLDDLNEQYMIDIDFVTAIVKKSYEARYNFVHNPQGSIELIQLITQHVSGTDSGEMMEAVENIANYRQLSLAINSVLNKYTNDETVNVVKE